MTTVVVRPVAATANRRNVDGFRRTELVSMPFGRHRIHDANCLAGRQRERTIRPLRRENMCGGRSSATGETALSPTVQPTR